MKEAELAITVMSYSSVLLTVVSTTTKTGAQYVKAMGVRPDVISLVGLMVGCSYYGAMYGFEASIVKQMVSLFLTVLASGTIVPYMVERICKLIKKNNTSCGVTMRLAMSVCILIGLIVLDSYLGELIISGLKEKKHPKDTEKVLYTESESQVDPEVRIRFLRELHKRRLEDPGEPDLSTTSLEATRPPE